jgi:hypothetical protein
MSKLLSLFTLIFILFLVNIPEGSAQQIMYSRNFQPLKDVKNIKELPVNYRVRIVDRMYRLGGSVVIEYYEQGTGKFLGFLGEPEKWNWELDRLPYVKKRKELQKLLAENEGNPTLAAALYHKEPVEGMTPEVVLSAMGEPIERRGQGGSQTWVYEGNARVFFVNGVVFRFQGPSSEN